ncbi:MAG: hypothetical protein KAR36_01340 [Candidatus Latescibacteria bacterium]|nr:hypothetical protein [Candidatus Latescibacterota bacterium]
MRVSTDFPLLKMPTCSILPETKIACSVLEMQDDQAIFFFLFLGCVRHSRSGSGGSGFAFLERNQLGADGLRLVVREVPEKGLRAKTVYGGNQCLNDAFLILGEEPSTSFFFGKGRVLALKVLQSRYVPPIHFFEESHVGPGEFEVECGIGLAQFFHHLREEGIKLSPERR